MLKFPINFEALAVEEHARKLQLCKDTWAVMQGEERRSMLLEDPLERKNYPNLVWVERRIRLEKRKR